MALVSGAAQSHLLPVARRVTKSKGAVLFRGGEPAFGVFLVRKGSVGLRLEAEGGNTLWDRIVTRDSIIGLPGTLAGGSYSLTAVTLEESELAFIDRQTLIELIKSDPSLGLELMHVLGNEVLQARLASTQLRQASRQVY